MTTEDDNSALVVIDAAPMQMHSADAVLAQLTGYYALQARLDRAMPDQIIQVGDKQFRKKGYWRTVGGAFHLSVELVEERREVDGTFMDGRDNFGYLATYRATAPNGRAATGDGACFAVEKAPRRSQDVWSVRPVQATEHNVRAHAHTRAYNRAISNLVGFGEVSFDEIDAAEERAAIQDEGNRRSAAPAQPALATELDDDFPPPARASAPAAFDGAVISEGQDKRYFAIAKTHGWKTDVLRAWLRDTWGYDDSRKIPKGKKYEDICAALADGPPR